MKTPIIEVRRAAMTFEEAQAAALELSHEAAASKRAKEQELRELAAKQSADEQALREKRSRRCANDVFAETKKLVIDLDTRMLEHARLESEEPVKRAEREALKGCDNPEAPDVFDKIVRLGVWLEVAQAQKTKLSDWIAGKRESAMDLSQDLVGVYRSLMRSYESTQKARLSKHLQDFCDDDQLQNAVDALYPFTNLPYAGEEPFVDYNGDAGHLKRSLDCVLRAADAFARAKIPLPPGAESLKRK